MPANEYAAGELEGIITDTGPVRRWIKAICRICGGEYIHLPSYRPETCQRLECSLKAKGEREREKN